MFTSRSAAPVSVLKMDQALEQAKTLAKQQQEQAELVILKDNLLFQLKKDGKYLEHKWLNIYSGDSVGHISCQLFLKAIEYKIQPGKDVYSELKRLKRGIFSYLVKLHADGDESVFLLMKKVFEDRNHPISLLFYEPKFFSCSEDRGVLKDIKAYIIKHSQVEMKELVKSNDLHKP